MSANLWWLIHEHPGWTMAHLVVACILAPRAVVLVVKAWKRG